MEIPYTVTARPDTGLWNAKIGIWLFLASEVMLFGGLFSSYVFLRIGADYPWPVHELGVIPGFINTFVLIFSSVTVVFAWAFLKMRQYGKYKICMALTLLFALAFLGIKSYEYYGKFNHWAVRLADGSVLDGHEPHHTIEFTDVTAINVDLRNSEVSFLAGAGADVNTNFKLPDGTIAEGYKVALKRLREVSRKGTARITVEGPPLKLAANRRKVASYLGNELTFRDGTRVEGKLGHDTLHIEVSGYDLRQVRGLKENLSLGDNALVWKFLGDEHRKEFLKTKEEVLAEFEKEKNANAKDAASRREPQNYGEVMRAAFKGEHLGHDAHAHVHVPVSVPASEVAFFSNYSPHLNTYYAIYFLMTGLHGLHVIGGAIVLGHFFFFGRRLYEKNPEHLANRVEVGGLFWHFVDLVWIFLFPVFYLL